MRDGCVGGGRQNQCLGCYWIKGDGHLQTGSSKHLSFHHFLFHYFVLLHRRVNKECQWVSKSGRRVRTKKTQKESQWMQHWERQRQASKKRTQSLLDMHSFCRPRPFILCAHSPQVAQSRQAGHRQKCYHLLLWHLALTESRLLGCLNDKQALLDFGPNRPVALLLHIYSFMESVLYIPSWKDKRVGAHSSLMETPCTIV